MFALRRLLAGFFLLITIPACTSAPATTSVRDVLYNADGTPLNGIVVITWPAFTAADGTQVPASSLDITVSNGQFSADLIPTTNAQTPATYSVQIISNGTNQTNETWSVPPSSSPVSIALVLVSSAPGGALAAAETTVANIGSVAGLATELAARPVMGTGYAISRAAVIDSTGAIAAAAGDPSDCVKVDGTSGPCGAGANAGFVDAEVPTGVVDGANAGFSLSQTPSPAASVMLERNGLVLQQGTDYSITGNTVTFQAAAVPQPGDILQASYRTAASGPNGNTFVGNMIGTLTGNASTATAFETAPTGCTAPSTWARTQDASGNFNCTQPASADLSDVANLATLSGTQTLANKTLTAPQIGQGANGNDLLASSRATDVSPAGNFENFKSASGSSLWRVDVTGTLQAGIVPGGNISGSISGNAATATSFAATPTGCGTNQWAISQSANGNFTCAQPASANLSDAPNLATLSGTQTLTNKTVDGVTPATMGYLDATSSIQTQLNGKQAAGTYAGVGNCATGQYATGTARGTTQPCAQIAYSQISGAPTLGTAAQQNVAYFLQSSNNLSDLGSASGARSNLGLGTAATANTGTSGANIPLLSAANAWGATQTFAQGANGNDMVAGARFTDTSPSGNFMNFKSAAGTSLWQVDVTGTLQAGTVPGARVTGNISGNAGTANALMSTPSQCAAGQFATGISVSGNANCGVPAGGGNVGISGSTASGNVVTGAGAQMIQDSGKAAPSGAFVGTTDVQTLANKTLTAPVIGQGSNGNDMVGGSRFTDTSPTGNFMNFKSAAGSPLWQVDATGTLQAGTIPATRVLGSLPGTLPASTSALQGVTVNGVSNQQIPALPLSVKDFGVAGNGKIDSGECSISSGSAVLTCSDNPFSSGDVGKSIEVSGAAAGFVQYLSNVNITNNGGSGCTTASGSGTIIFSGGAGTGATAAFAVSGGTIAVPTVGSMMSAGGGGYTSVPTFTIAQGACAQQPTATATVNVQPISLRTTIASYQSAGQVTLAAGATVTVSNSPLVFWATDDTASFQTALNYGGQLTVPAGNYWLSGSGTNLTMGTAGTLLYLEPNAYLRMCRPNDSTPGINITASNTAIIARPNTHSKLVQVDGAGVFAEVIEVSGPVSHVKLEGFEIDGNGNRAAVGEHNYGIYATGSGIVDLRIAEMNIHDMQGDSGDINACQSDCVWHHNYITNLGRQGISFGGNPGTTRIVVDENTCSMGTRVLSSTSWGNCIHWEQTGAANAVSHGINISHNSLSDVGISVTTTDGPAGSPSYLEGVVVEGNTLYNINYGDGIVVSETQNCVIQGNTISAASIAGGFGGAGPQNAVKFLQASSTNSTTGQCLIEGNVITGPWESFGINISQSGSQPFLGGVQIKANYINGIAAASVTGLSISAGGTGYATATNVATTGGSGTGLTVNILSVSSGAISAVGIANPGRNYMAGDTVTITGGGANGTLSVLTVNTGTNGGIVASALGTTAVPLTSLDISGNQILGPAGYCISVANTAGFTISHNQCTNAGGSSGISLSCTSCSAANALINGRVTGNYIHWDTPTGKTGVTVGNSAYINRIDIFNNDLADAATPITIGSSAINISNYLNRTAASATPVLASSNLPAPFSLNSLNAHGVLVGEGSGNISATSAGAADTVLQGQGSAADPTYVSLVSCSGASNALTYSTTTHTFGCNTLGGANSNWIATAFCSNTVGTASGTTYVLQPAQSGTTGVGCTITAAVELPMPYAGTASSLFVTAGTAGAVSGSGVVTLYRNGAATAITCTLGIGKACSDTTDTVNFNAGDTWSVRVTTGQANDTTAGIHAAFRYQ